MKMRMKITFGKTKWSVLLLALLLCVGCSSVGAAPVSDPCFQLNGQDYPAHPVVQDFLDRGWKLDEATQYSGDYTPEDGPSNVIPTGYCLTDGEQRITVNLAVEERRDGVEPENCHLVSLSAFGSNVDSVQIEGHELSGTDPEELASWLGEPDSKETESVGTICNYEMDDGKLTQLQVAFPAALDTVGQILIVFDRAE